MDSLRDFLFRICSAFTPRTLLNRKQRMSVVFRRALRRDCPHSHISLDAFEVSLDQEAAAAMARILFVYRTSEIEPCFATACVNLNTGAAMAG